MIKKLKAMRDELIVLPLESEVTKSGIILVKNVKDNNTAKVVSIGPDYPHKKEVKVGDTIFYRQNEGVRFKLDGKLYLKLRARWVECVIGEDEK